MPLQIRRGTTAERLSITPLVGEPVFDTTLNQIFVGDGTTAGGVSPDVAAETVEQALDTVGAALVNGVHQNISFTYGTAQDIANRIDATVSVATLLEDLDLNEFDIVGTGNINITGTITGNIKGSVFADDSTLLVDGTNGTIPWAVISDAPTFLTEIPGSITSDVTGSIFSDNSTLIVDAVNNIINIDTIVTTDTLEIVRPDLDSQTTLRVQSVDRRSNFRLTKSSDLEFTESIFEEYGGIIFERRSPTTLRASSVILGGSNRILFTVDQTEVYGESSFVTILENVGLGIGTFTPTEALDVRGNASVTGFSKTGSFTSTERDGLTPAYGMIIYNTTLNKFQGYQNTSGTTPEWVDLS